jgi:signal transduction histidine kinase
MQKIILQQEVYEKTKELREVNEEMQQQAESLRESNYTKDKLFSIISHDLRGPVHQLREIFKLMGVGYISIDEFKNELMPGMKEKTNYIATLIDNLLHWARGQMGGIEVKPTTFSIADAVQENINLLHPQASNKSITLKADVPDVSVYADLDMIKLVLRNLISNALKFTPVGGVVEVTARTEKDVVYISVHDTGTGLAMEDINKINGREYFTKYGTSGEKGSGLGLMLCREFVEKNGGKLTIQSTVNVGSTFTFDVPLDNATNQII